MNSINSIIRKHSFRATSLNEIHVDFHKNLKCRFHYTLAVLNPAFV